MVEMPKFYHLTGSNEARQVERLKRVLRDDLHSMACRSDRRFAEDAAWTVWWAMDAADRLARTLGCAVRSMSARGVPSLVGDADGDAITMPFHG